MTDGIFKEEKQKFQVKELFGPRKGMLVTKTITRKRLKRPKELFSKAKTREILSAGDRKAPKLKVKKLKIPKQRLGPLGVRGGSILARPTRRRGLQSDPFLG